jgi:hypothetical protein
MKITPGIGIALGLGAAGLVASGVALAHALGGDDHDERAAGKTVGEPHPPVLTPEDAGLTSVNTVAEQLLEHYDHSGDGSIDIGWGQQYSADERVTGAVGDIHTMVGFFRAADGDKDKSVTRDELIHAITRFDTGGINGAGVSDGLLGERELADYRSGAISRYSEQPGWIDDRGVQQVVTGIDGKTRNNEGFFHELPDYRPLT